MTAAVHRLSPVTMIRFLFLLACLASASAQQLQTGPNVDLGGVLLMPAEDEWNRDASKDEVDPLSDAMTRSSCTR